MQVKLLCYKNDPHLAGVWQREIVFPFAPFIGMHVGAHTVEEVFVCQGGLDGEGEINVRLEDVQEGEGAILGSQGWDFCE